MGQDLWEEDHHLLEHYEPLVTAERRRRNSYLESVYTIFSESRFFVALILNATYLILTVVPSIVRFVWCEVTNEPSPLTLTVFYIISTRISSTTDAIVYIFLSKPIRDFLKGKIVCLRNDSSSDVSHHINMAVTTEHEDL